MAIPTRSTRAAQNRFWGLGWGLFYVAALYFTGIVLVQYTGDRRLWALWVISAIAAIVSALAVSAYNAPPMGICKTALYAAHYLNLTYAIVFTVLGIIGLLGHRQF